MNTNYDHNDKNLGYYIEWGPLEETILLWYSDVPLCAKVTRDGVNWRKDDNFAHMMLTDPYLKITDEEAKKVLDRMRKQQKE